MTREEAAQQFYDAAVTVANEIGFLTAKRIFLTEFKGEDDPAALAICRRVLDRCDPEVETFLDDAPLYLPGTEPLVN